MRYSRRAALKALGLAAGRPLPALGAAFGLGAATSAHPSAMAGPTDGTPRGEVRGEVRGTWLTTTANQALATPGDTESTMRRLRRIGLNTVYVECWKNGYTQYPSEVLRRAIGVSQRPAGALQDPSEAAANPAGANRPLPQARNLLEESVIEAHRQGLVHIAWFEYGFMAAHGQTHNHLRRLRPDWLSRDRQGREVAPNGFVWMNPLRLEVRQFLLDLTLEAIDHHDLDGVQFDDRIVWPHVTMGYDEHTRVVYAAEHAGRQPPDNPHDPGWMRWRADKLNALAADFAARLRQALPGRVLSLSPAVYPWSWENYLLDWPSWARWPDNRRWTELVPQAYRFSFDAFKSTWQQQTRALQDAGAYRASELVAGIRIVGEGRDSSWDQLRASIDLTRALGQGGHVLWFSRGVLDLYAQELTAYYGGFQASPRFPPDWRRPAIAATAASLMEQGQVWTLPARPRDRYRVIAHDGTRWHYLDTTVTPDATALTLPARWQRVELLVDRRGQRPVT